MQTNQPTRQTTGNPQFSPQPPMDQRLKDAAETALDQGVTYVRRCVKENPEAAALWCLGIGFVLGWKLKPW